ncbi:MAG: hypothetical protein VW985_03505 [Gammaproteobacteria bacterium]
MQELRDIGFLEVGVWMLGSGGLKFELSVPVGESCPALYAFTFEEQLLYLGKTRRPLRQRLYGYQRPGESQRTNMRIHELLNAHLQGGGAAAIIALLPSVPLRIGRFALDIASGLEDDLIGQLNPPWNVAGSSAHRSTPVQTENQRTPKSVPKREIERSGRTTAELKPHFLVKLGKTYYNQGFFNVPVDYSRYFPRDGMQIRVILGSSGTHLSATVNRRANKGTDAPRIMAGARFADWVKNTFRLGEHMRVTVESKTEIRVARA